MTGGRDEERHGAVMRKVEHKLLFESVADTLRQAILNGDFQPGERLNEVSISRTLNLSRGPIREALRQLAQEGMITLIPQRGARVVEVDQREALAALAIRELLETMAAEELCEVITPKQIGHLRDVTERMRRAEQDREFVDMVSLDFQFHRDLMDIASTDTARRTWTILSGKLMLFQSIGDRTFALSLSVSDSHWPIIDALERRDAKRFRTTMLGHIEENRSSVLGFPEPSADDGH
ncbi:GntR family transcriptional regulator [Streptomyces iranensis]|uniref:GntR family transcriptional regulator n=1 Tax=Streptomyces iranensis TaxID=576784 RepID=UPI0039B75B56